MLFRDSLISRGKEIKETARAFEEEYSAISSKFEDLCFSLPNSPSDDTPLGSTEDANVELEVYGKPAAFDFEPRDHIELAKGFGMDLEAGVRVAGSGFPLLKGVLAQYENAILQFAYDQAIQENFTPVSVPLLARTSILRGIGFNPRRSDEGTEIFFTAHDDLCLSGTAEIPLVGQFSGQTLPAESLPIKLVAKTPCFRREGAHGRRDAGLYRNRMFHKVELVVLTTPDRSLETHEQIRAFETNIYKKLDIHFRVINICSGDLGAPAYKKYDIEGWMMGRAQDGSASWGELTSCSNCTDYQAKRLMIRSKAGSEKPQFVHTLNGTGITTRTLICLLEQNQLRDGSVVIPEVLRPYMNGKELLPKTS